MEKNYPFNASLLRNPQDLFEDYDDGFDSYPSHIVDLYENWKEILNLIEIQDEYSISGKKSKKRLDALNKASLVLLIANWEAFIEDLATNAFEFLIENANDPSAFPNKVLSLASKSLIDDPNNTRVWKLSGEGWKSVLADHREAVLNRYVGRLNTPKPAQVDILFRELIGYKNISSKWYWRGISHNSVIKKLETLVSLRGEIAHRVNASRKIRKNDIINHAMFISRISVITSNNIGVFIGRRVHKECWKLLRIGEVYG